MDARSWPSMLFAPSGARLDSLDVAILRILHGRARTPNQDIASEIGLSPSATLQRVRRLEASGVIRGYVANLDEAVLSPWVQAWVEASLSPAGRARRHEFDNALRQEPQVLEAWEMTGEFDLALKISVPRLSDWPKLQIRLDPKGELADRWRVQPILYRVKSAGPHPLLAFQSKDDL